MPSVELQVAHSGSLQRPFFNGLNHSSASRTSAQDHVPRSELHDSSHSGHALTSIASSLGWTAVHSARLPETGR
jgi:hypothetical protein